MKIRGRQLWKLPSFAVDGYEADVVFERGRHVELRWEDTPQGDSTLRIAFPGCDAYRVTFRDAMGLIGEGTADIAWGHLAEIVVSDWLDATRVPPRQRAGKPCPPLRHFAVCLFDGPCFEFLAGDFVIEEDGKPVDVADPGAPRL